MYTLTTRINGEEVEVEFTFDKGYDATWDEPGATDDWEVHKVWYKGVDVLPLLCDRYMDEIDEAVMKCMENDDDV